MKIKQKICLIIKNFKKHLENKSHLKIFGNQEHQNHLENISHLKEIFDNHEHQQQLENRSQLREIFDNQDYNVKINLYANPNKVHQFQLVFNHPIKVLSNKKVRKLKWISNYKEYFKEFIKNIKLKSKDYYNKFNTKKNFKKGDKTWSIKKPNKNKVERDKHKNS